MLKAAGIIISAIIILQACSGSSTKEQQADVTSQPSGATVYANDVKLGDTPLNYKLYKAFPASWKDAMYQAHGVLLLKMDGCEDYTLNVNDYILSNPIHAELKCAEASKSEELTPTAPQTETEKRLGELEALYNKGVITKEEYNTTRERILNEL